MHCPSSPIPSVIHLFLFRERNQEEHFEIYLSIWGVKVDSGMKVKMNLPK